MASYTDDQFSEAVKTSRVYVQIVKKLGIEEDSEETYAEIKQKIQDMGLDTSHMINPEGLRYSR